MEVVIKEIIGNRVIFMSEYGSGNAKWNSEAPKINQPIHVELDISNKLTLGKEVSLLKSSKYRINYFDNTCIICGQIEYVGEDECVAVRIGNSTFLCEIEGIKGHESEYIEIRTTDLEISDVNY